MKIFGFYHILLINHWIEVVNEQLRIVVDNGLYNACEKIYIGCLGKEENLIRLKEILKEYPKYEVEYHSETVEEYEYATMRILKQKADESQEPFYGFYYHTKAISWPKERRASAYIGGTYWRNYLNFYNLKRWMDGVAKLNEGYDTCGVKLLQPNESPAKKLHYSGTYFFFKSEYAKKLPLVESLNTSDRMEAELYICYANPNAATLCQDFVDYRNKGIWKDPY